MITLSFGSILIFLAGAAIGAGGMWYFGKRWYSQPDTLESVTKKMVRMLNAESKQVNGQTQRLNDALGLLRQAELQVTGQSPEEID